MTVSEENFSKDVACCLWGYPTIFWFLAHYVVEGEKHHRLVKKMKDRMIWPTATCTLSHIHPSPLQWLICQEWKDMIQDLMNLIGGRLH